LSSGQGFRAPPLPVPLSPAPQRFSKMLEPDRGGEGLTTISLSPRAAVAMLPCPGLLRFGPYRAKTYCPCGIPVATVSSTKIWDTLGLH
jgi:hypothetical protein